MTVIISGFDCSLSIVFAILDLFSIRKRCSIPLLRSFQQAVLPCHQDGVHAPHCGMQGFFHPLSTAHLSNCLTCYDCSWSSNTLMLKKKYFNRFFPPFHSIIQNFNWLVSLTAMMVRTDFCFWLQTQFMIHSKKLRKKKNHWINNLNIFGKSFPYKKCLSILCPLK